MESEAPSNYGTLISYNLYWLLVKEGGFVNSTLPNAYPNIQAIRPNVWALCMRPMKNIDGVNTCPLARSHLTNGLLFITSARIFFWKAEYKCFFMTCTSLFQKPPHQDAKLGTNSQSILLFVRNSPEEFSCCLWGNWWRWIRYVRVTGQVDFKRTCHVYTHHLERSGRPQPVFFYFLMMLLNYQPRDMAMRGLFYLKGFPQLRWFLIW